MLEISHTYDTQRISHPGVDSHTWTPQMFIKILKENYARGAMGLTIVVSRSRFTADVIDGPVPNPPQMDQGREVQASRGNNADAT